VKPRYLVLALAIALLGVLNLWQWAPAGAPARERAVAGAGGLRAEDFQLRAGSVAADSARGGRDLFRMRLPPPPPPAKPEPVVVKVEEPPPGPPPKTPEQIAEESARAELEQVKLVGVVFRGERGQAFLVKGDQLYMVQTGGKVGERFQVESIRPDSIQLKDPATRVTGSIPVSGK
jgi:hypothetical protein